MVQWGPWARTLFKERKMNFWFITNEDDDGFLSFVSYIEYDPDTSNVHYDYSRVWFFTSQESVDKAVEHLREYAFGVFVSHPIKDLEKYLNLINQN